MGGALNPVFLIHSHVLVAKRMLSHWINVLSPLKAVHTHQTECKIRSRSKGWTKNSLVCWTFLFIVLVLFVCSCSVCMHTLKFFPECQLHCDRLAAQAYSTENFFSRYWLLQIFLCYCLVSRCESIKFHCNSKSVLFPWYTFKTIGLLVLCCATVTQSS